MHVTVCVGTRGVDATCVATIRSILRSDYDDFDVVVVDQGRDPVVAEALRREFGSDSRLRHVPSNRVGASAARNVAASVARGPLLAYTDDDCEVAPDWLASFVSAFETQPRVGLIFGSVKSGTLRTGGFVPEYLIPRARLLTKPVQMWLSHGISANVAIRLQTMRLVGGFDEILGSGAPLPSCEDWDIAYRVLRSGSWVLELPESQVVHFGFRTWDQARTLMRRTGFAAGATWMKYLRLRDGAILPTLLLNAFHGISWPRLLLFQRRSGATWPVTYAMGLAASFRFAVDKRDRVYRARASTV